VQEFRFALSEQIRQQVFYATFVRNIETVIDKQERQRQQRVSLYEQYRKNSWTREQYAEERLKLSRDMEQTEGEAESLKAEIARQREVLNKEDYNRFVSTFSKYAEISELTPDLVDELIERIGVFDAAHVKIQVKYMDEWQRMLKLLEK